MLELLLLKEWNHEDSAIVSTNDRRRGALVLEDDIGIHLFISKEEAELTRVVERLEHLRVKVDESVGDMRLTLFRLRAEQGQVADIHRDTEVAITN